MTVNFKFFFKSVFGSVAKVLFLAVFCALAGLVISWPLWKFASSAPRVYTAVLLSAAAAFLLFCIVRAVRKAPPKKTLKILLNILIAAGGIVLAAALVLNGLTLPAVPVLVLIPILCALCTALLS